jgi:hypothetical protein
MWMRIRPSSCEELKLDLNSEDTKYWQAGYELGQGLSGKETKEPLNEIIQKEFETPQFLKDTLGRPKG